MKKTLLQKYKYCTFYTFYYCEDNQQEMGHLEYNFQESELSRFLLRISHCLSAGNFFPLAIVSTLKYDRNNRKKEYVSGLLWRKKVVNNEEGTCQNPVKFHKKRKKGPTSLLLSVVQSQNTTSVQLLNLYHLLTEKNKLQKETAERRNWKNSRKHFTQHSHLLTYHYKNQLVYLACSKEDAFVWNEKENPAAPVPPIYIT